MAPSAQRTAPGTAAQHAVEALRAAIVAGEIGPGDRVGQEDVAAHLGISTAPVREALAVLEQEGQVTYLPRRGYFVTELDLADLREIYELREVLESRAARKALPLLDTEAIERLELLARECETATGEADVAAGLDANRRFHLALLTAPDQPHTLKLIRLLWDSTETYRAMYYNAEEARADAVAAHARVLDAIRERDAKRLVAELDAHRTAALDRLAETLPA
jgi:DNA-binding GntR family transcriptional regulator